MKIKPILDKVVAKVQKSENTTRGGLVLAKSSNKDEPIRAEVIARGDGGMTDDGRKLKMYIEAGDTILVPKDAGTTFKTDGNEYVIISQKDVLAVIYPNT
ncbi:MAG: co-chaperone GroES [Clostridia bacterium]|nr:co-chaperone GroES [Clostridia bacterium]